MITIRKICLLTCSVIFVSCERSTTAGGSAESKTNASAQKDLSLGPHKSSNSPELAIHPQNHEASKTTTSFLDAGVGANRLNQLTKQLAGMSPEEIESLLSKNISILMDEDLGPLSQIEDKLINLTPDTVIDLIQNSPSPAFTNYFHSILKEQGFKFGPNSILEIADKLTDVKFKKEFVHDTITKSMQTHPLEVIPNIPAIFKVLSSGANRISEETLSDTSGSRALKEFGEVVPAILRDDTWKSLSSIPDEGFRIMLAAGIFEGQLSNDAISASQWLNTLPESPEKSAAIRVLVSDLYRHDDGSSADAWLLSAKNYLRPGDLANIKIFQKEYLERMSK